MRNKVTEKKKGKNFYKFLRHAYLEDGNSNLYSANTMKAKRGPQNATLHKLQ